MTANTSLVVIDTEQFFARLEETLERKLKERIEEAKAPDQADKMPEWLSRKQVASFFGLSLATVDNLTKSGVLKKHYLSKVPRFNRDEIRAAFDGWKKYQRG